MRQKIPMHNDKNKIEKLVRNDQDKYSKRARFGSNNQKMAPGFSPMTVS